MADPRRRLAAIMVGDLVGYTALMAIDEERALGMVRRMRVIVPPLVREHGGRWIKDVGDGFLASFGSAVTAVECAVAIQRSLTEDNVRLRIGIHLGDVIFTDSDVFGDGVNIAARLELLAKPGGICVSGQVHEFVRNQAGIRSVRMGETSLGVEGYAVAGEDMELPDRHEAKAARAHASEKSDFIGRYGNPWAWARWLGALALVASIGAFAAFAYLTSGNRLPDLDGFSGSGGGTQQSAAIPTVSSTMSDAPFVTTASETARAHFRRGVAAAARLDWPVAEAAAALAVDDDPKFASAYLLLGVARNALGRASESEAEGPLAKAEAHAESLPPSPERDLIVGAAARAEGRCLEADAALQSVEEAAPEWYAAHIGWELTSRADALNCAGRSDEAREHLMELAANDDPAALAALIAQLLAVDGDLVAARRTVRRAQRSLSLPVRPDIELFEAVELTFNGDLEAARRELLDLLGDVGELGSAVAQHSSGVDDRVPPSPDTRIRARMLLASVELRADDPEAAERQLELASAEALAADLPEWRAEAGVQRAALAGLELGDAAERGLLAELSASLPEASGERLLRRQALLQANAGLGLTDAMRIELADDSDLAEGRAYESLMIGIDRLGKDDPSDAIESLASALAMGPITVRAGAPSSWRNSVVAALIAQAYYESGDDAAALVIQRRLAGRDVQIAYAGSIVETAIWLGSQRAVREADGGL